MPHQNAASPVQNNAQTAAASTRSRRQFLRESTAFAAAFGGLQQLLGKSAWAEAVSKLDAASTPGEALPGLGNFGPYGKLVADPAGLLDLPHGFTYKIISRQGEKMDDGLLVPGAPDGMAALPGPNGKTLLMRNHELSPETTQGAFGEQNELLSQIDSDLLYDQGQPTDGQEPGKLARGLKSTPNTGAVSTIVYDTKKQEVVSQFLSLAGTIRNCAGGPTPWNSWITCEETVDRPNKTENDSFLCNQDHGYAFDVPASDQIGLTKPVALKSMGRFRREAVAVHPSQSIVYQTEDMDDGAFYRFLADEPGNLAAGGRLQALAIVGKPSLDTRNWQDDAVSVGQSFEVEWIDMDEPESPEDDLRYRSFEAGAACFARGEGIWMADDAAYFACTSGGHKRIGQLWRYIPSPSEGTPGESSERGKLELFLESNDSNLLKNADNLTAAPWGDLIVCEDRQEPVVRLVGVTPEGEPYTLANSHAESEFAGVTFSPDGSTLFVNVQVLGLTLAIQGPWMG